MVFTAAGSGLGFKGQQMWAPPVVGPNTEKPQLSISHGFGTLFPSRFLMQAINRANV